MYNDYIKETVDRELSFINSNQDEGWEKISKRIDELETTKKNNAYTPKPIVAAAIISIAVLVPAGSVFAYQYYQNIYRLPDFEQHVVSENSTVENNVEDDSFHYLLMVKESDFSNSMENLQIQWTGQQLTENRLIMTFELTTKDGSPLIQDSENKAPTFSPIVFETIEITIDDLSRKISGVHKPYEFFSTEDYIGCTSISDNYSKAEFELSLSLEDDSHKLQGKEICVRLNNLMGSYHIFDDLQTNGTLGELLTDAPEGEPVHIIFSQDYPECYIDYYEFVNDSAFDNQENILHIMPYNKEMFTMTVVCDSESKDTIRNMVLQNKITGLNGSAETHVKELPDGRLQFYYSVNYDGSYVNKTEPRDTTFEDLQQLVLKFNGQHVQETLITGTIEEKIALE